jgi:type I restriction enzyme S subunit
MKAWQGSMGIAPCDGIVSPAYFVYDFNISNRSFGQALLRSKPYVSHFAQASDGVRIGQWDLTIAFMRQIPVLVPHEEEQAAIVRFLTWANSRLERAIKAKQKQITLLDEQKQAIIHRAVTRGLDPSVPLKPSGIPCLGEIPAHWMVRRLRQIVFVKPSKSESIERLRQDDFVTFLPMERVKTNSTIDSSVQVTASSVWNGFTYFRRGDVIVAKITPCFENGKGAYLDKLPTEIGFGSTEFHVLRPGPLILGEYLRLVTASKLFLDNGTHSMTGSAGQQRVPTDFVKNYSIALPEVEEQHSILDSVGCQVSEIDTLIVRLEREIELLREYRTRLVSNVVTGKLDVREVAAKLPEEEIEEAVEAHEDMESADEEIAV